MNTEDDWTLACARFGFGAIFFAHGAQKMLGWFGGRGFSGYMDYLHLARHIPVPLAFLAIAAEFFGSLGLMAGLLTRVAAVAIAINMAVAIGLVHIHFGFFMDWNSSKKGEGMKFCLLALLMCMIVFVKGAGALSVDLWWSRAAGRRPVTGKSKGTRTNQPRATIVRS